jgi:hypothetical protein
METPLRGGEAQCLSCGSVATFEPLEEATSGQDDWEAAPRDEGRRFADLRAQDGVEIPYPDSVADMARDPDLEELHRRLRDTLAELREGAAFAVQERAFFLAFLLSNELWRGSDDRLLRAALETTLEHVESTRYRQILRCRLVRAAARCGELDAARQWLDACEEHSDDLLVDSAYRVARAELATVREDWREVLELLGDSLDAVPTADMYDEHVELLRGNALERRGRRREAVEQLVAGMKRSDLSIFVTARENNPHLHLCPESYAEAAESAHSPPSRIRRALGALPMAAFLIFPLMTCFSGTFLRGCAPEPYEAALRRVEACPRATEALGDSVDGTVGVGCGSLETGGGHGYLDWNVPVAGDRGRGTMYLSASQRGGRWTLDAVELEANDETINILSCSAKNDPQGSTQQLRQ